MIASTGAWSMACPYITYMSIRWVGGNEELLLTQSAFKKSLPLFLLPISKEKPVNVDQLCTN